MTKGAPVIRSSSTTGTPRASRPRGRAPDRTPRRWLPLIAAGTTIGLAAASIGGGAAFAAPEDRAESEGLFLSGGSGDLNLDAVAGLAGAYGAFPPASESSAPLDLTLLSTLNLGAGIDLFGGNDILTLGAVGQYQSAEAGSAYAASGLLTADGAIATGTGAPGENTVLSLTPLLGALGVDPLISALSVELGAVSASATATRTAGAVDYVGDYQIASGVVDVEAPLVAALAADLDTTLTALGTTVTALGADGGPIDGLVGGLLDDIDGILEDLLGGLVDLDDPVVTTTLATDLSGVIETAIADPFISGPLTVTLGDGGITIDLDEVYDLNNLAVGTELLDGTTLSNEVAVALDDILTTQLPTRILTALTSVLNATALDISLTSGVDLLGLPVGDLAVTVDGTVGGLLGLTGSTAPTVSLAGTDILGLPVGDLLEPVTDLVVDALLPLVGDLLEPLLGTPVITGTVSALADVVLTALDPLLDVVNQIVSITANVQAEPGDFRDGAGLDAGSFTQRALSVSLLSGTAVLDLASATVRAIPLAAPVGTAIVPDRGPVTGGTDVTITGTNLGDVTAVDFGGVPATTFTVNPDGTITATTPPQAAPGIVPVTLTNVDGTDSTLTFEYFDVTSVDSITPDSGTTLGGDDVTIVGDCLTGTTAVLFGGVAGTDLVVDPSGTSLTVTTPPGAAGAVDVEIVNATECGGIVVDDGFVYVAPGAPTLTSLDPDRGTELGGTVVTITGEDFNGTTSVTFDGVAGTDLDVISDTELEITTPPGEVGLADVVITNAAGASAPLDFEYFDVVEIDSVTPDSGPETGGNEVVIVGDCFADATAVLFGGVPATAFTVNAEGTEITATVPAGTPGVVDVEVVGVGDCGTGLLEDGYEYIAAPVVDDLTPTEGPETGGTVVTITGDGLGGTTDVLFDTAPGTDVTVNADGTELTVTTPPGTPGVVTVTVVHPGGDVDAGDFEYLDVPSITSLTPNVGPEDGGTVVTIEGEGFLGATGVLFGDESGVDVLIVDDTTITVTTPPQAPAVVDVVVTHDNGDSAPGAFEYIAGTEIDAVTPPGGPEEGGTVVVITGACFTDATQVLFGTEPATSFTIDSDTQITAIAPPGVGVVDVTVVGSDLCGTDTVPDGYEYTDEPVIGTIAPVRGPETGGTVVTITGSNFDGVTSVTFDGVAGTTLTVVSDTELRVTTPAGTPGAADVLVTSAEGTGDPGVFTYYAVTDIDGTDPGTGPVTGGTSVIITGQCFTGATQVLFGQVPAQFQVLSDTVIRAMAPPAAATGAVDITVVGAGECGTAVQAGAFTYTPAGTAAGRLPATGGSDAGLGALTAAGLLLLLGGGMAILRRRTA